MNIYNRSKTLRRIEESMTDLLLCELFGTQPLFVAALAQRLGLKGTVEVSSVRRSVHETSLGETDIEVILESGLGKLGLLIENKIRAVLMQDQLGRYRQRGADGAAKGLWQTYIVALFSPEAYRSYIPESEATVVDGFLSYEWVRDWLEAEDPVSNAFKIHVLTEAIADSRSGYVKKLDGRMTNFHQSVHAIAQMEYPELKMAWVDQAGYDSSIIHLPHALPVRGDSLLLKAKMGTAELRVETRDPISAERALSSVIPPEWRTTRAKGYAGVEIAIGLLDPTRPFSTIEDQVRRFLEALKRLHDFYHQRHISEIIEANRGIRPARGKSLSAFETSQSRLAE
ncbi:PD-(D/E)XK nuclease family protein [Sinorhizobium meliloti]|uniref:PD-(D/E)XK nuclease family protein n=1 Tax=Rhizobium meliloti TaxID=382 RepID=UPI0030ABB79D